MKRVIHKHHLDWVTDAQKISTPIGSKIVHVGIQFDRPTVWVEREVGPYADNHPSELYIKLMATGEEFERTRTNDQNEAIYLGTIHNDDISVWHLYQVRP